jgi:hypothetical protein
MVNDWIKVIDIDTIIDLGVIRMLNGRRKILDALAIQ